MKILFFSYAYPNPIHPGQGTFNRTMIAGLAGEHEVRVVTPIAFTDICSAWIKGKLTRGLNDPAFQAVPGVKAEYCPWYYTPFCLRTLYGRFMRASVRSRLDRVMREFQPDIVVSYWTHPDGEAAVEAAHRFGVRAVTIVGGSDVLINARRGLRRTAILAVLQKADAVVTVSESIRRVLIADGIAESKMHVVRRGIDRELFHPGDCQSARQSLGLPQDCPILVSVGRLVDVKGHVHLIEACRLLAERGVPFQCYLLGDGPLRPQLLKQIADCGLTDRVVLKGAQTSAQLGEWYRAADLSILASLSEGVPNVLLESIASQTAFVASNVGGIPEIADPDLDRLVPAGNPSALADGIEDRIVAIGTAHKRTRRFEPPSMSEAAETLSLILQSVVSGKSMLKLMNVVMHETMTEADWTESLVPTAPRKAINSFAPLNSRTSEEIDDNPAGGNREFLGRTGESFRVRPPSSASNATAVVGTHTSARDKADSTISTPDTVDEEMLARTGERFTYHHNTAENSL